MGKSKIQKPKSRAAKRVVTPPIELNVERPASPSQRQKVAVLGLRGDNGVQKKKALRGKQLSTKQKQRKEKMMERAEAVNEKLASKRDVSIQKSRVVQGRRGNWEVLNEKMQDDLEGALALATVDNPVSKFKV
ncbi:hypothetical protein K440DRAFT_543028 [Wilcoxina mikolae CBS 423.85]|nr:hypothetical protein K440DRAFT_543028 [Wilcoxina mikolae CBS 423.85]